VTPRELLSSFEVLTDAPDGLIRLRELVLQLGVRGQLVPQKPYDEPAKVLLERIAAVKARSQKSGTARKRKLPEPLVKDNEIEVPAGWELVRLGDLLQFQYGKSLPAKARTDGGQVPVYGSNGVVGFHDQPLVLERCIIVGRKGSAGAVNITSGASWPIDTCYFVIPPEGVSLEFAANVLVSLRLDELERATAVPGLNREEAYRQPVLLPPLAEQHRIVARVHELMGLLDRIEASKTTREHTRRAVRDSALAALQNAETTADVAIAWERIAERMEDLFAEPADVAPLRRMVLQLAVRGRVVPQDVDDEPANALLARIAVDRAAVLEAQQTRLGSDPGGYDEHDSLPVGWAWAPLQQVVQFIDYRGKTPPKTTSGVRLITAKNIRDGYIADEPLEFVTRRTYEHWMTRGYPRQGDVLFTTEAPMGKAALVDFPGEFALAQRVINFHPYADLDGKYIALMLLSPWFQQRLQERATGTTATGIKAAKLRLIRIPIPPVNEQHRVVARVEELMRLVDRLEERLAAMRDAHSAFAAAAVHYFDSERQASPIIPSCAAVQSRAPTT
jgi:type I restriction enzyme, S subunit